MQQASKGFSSVVVMVVNLLATGHLSPANETEQFASWNLPESVAQPQVAPAHDAHVHETVFRTSAGEGVVWPYKDYVAVVEGNVTIGGLMMVHERDELLVCGKIMPQGGIQATEAMLYTIDVINARNLIPGVKLGARIKDDCDRDIYGLEQSVDFIRGTSWRLGSRPVV